MSDNSFDLEKAVKNLHDLQKVGQELFGAGGAEREAREYKELKSVEGKVVGHVCVECGRLSTAPHKEECSIIRGPEWAR